MAAGPYSILNSLISSDAVHLFESMIINLSKMVYICNSRTGEAEAGELLQVLSFPGLCKLLTQIEQKKKGSNDHEQLGPHHGGAEGTTI